MNAQVDAERRRTILLRDLDVGARRKVDRPRGDCAPCYSRRNCLHAASCGILKVHWDRNQWMLAVLIVIYPGREQRFSVEFIPITCEHRSEQPPCIIVTVHLSMT